MIFSESFGKSVLVIYRLGKSVLVNLSFGKKCLGTDIFLTTPDLVSLRILESLHIFKSKPKLNDSNSSFPLNIVL